MRAAVVQTRAPRARSTGHMFTTARLTGNGTNYGEES